MAIFNSCTFTDKINIGILMEESLLENMRIYNKRNNLIISIYSTKIDSHDPSKGGRIKIYIERTPDTRPCDVYLRLGNFLKFGKDKFDSSWLERSKDPVNKMKSNHETVITNIMTRCGDAFLEYYTTDKLTEDKLADIVQHNCPEYNIHVKT